jgi:hypothetical protein
MDASDLIKTLQNTLQGGGRPHMENQARALLLLWTGPRTGEILYVG